MAKLEHDPKARRLLMLRTVLLSQPGRIWKTREIAELCDTSVDTAQRDLDTLGGTGGHLRLIKNGTTSDATWEVEPAAFTTLPPIDLDYSQGTALYAAARLLSQQYDERNDAVRAAILAVIGAFPPELHPHLLALAKQLQARTDDDRSEIFTVLSHGWLSQRRVKLLYEPLHGKAPFPCTFAPYILEPSAIGRTLYFIGHSDPPGQLRTYKFERIRHATLTDESFTIPADFDAAALLSQAWGVMYGDEQPITVRLRFSRYVGKRVRETRWHPSEHVTETDGGLVWEAAIGDIIEIKPWIRGWGSDCEVLEPVALREEMQTEVRRMARNYGIAFGQPSSPADIDQSLIDDLLGE